VTDSDPARSLRATNPHLGYQFAALNAAISGFAVFVNSIGVRMFADSTLYTTLKNGVVGVAFLLPFLLVPERRRELTRLDRGQWTLLVLIAVVAGSAAYALDFRGFQISTPATVAVIDHTQFLLVAAIAALFLRERVSPTILLALAVLAGGLALGLGVRALRMDSGVPFLVAGTLLFALGAVLMKAALRTVSVTMVVAVKMTLGSALLVAYLAANGRLGATLHLSALQWGFVLVTGLILLAFTLTEVVGLRHASATAVVAISAASPVITTLLVVATRRAAVAPTQLLGLGMVLAAVLVIYTIGRSQELRAWRLQQRECAGETPIG